MAEDSMAQPEDSMAAEGGGLPQLVVDEMEVEVEG